MKKFLALLLTVAMVFAMAACSAPAADETKPAEEGTAAPAEETSEQPAASGSVYYLNFKPEADAAWQELAKKYTELTGVPVKVVTAASGDYQTTLTSEMDKSEAPTLFQCGNQGALNTWGEYCLDLKDTDFYKEMTTDDFNLFGENGEVLAAGYCYEAFGIIVNKALLEKAGHSIDEITNFDTLKAVADDIHARAAELGFDAFSSSGLDGSSSWRFSGHLANMPLFYEFRDDNVTAQPATITGKYLDNYKAIWDLYTTDTATTGADLITATGDMSSGEFKEGKAVFYQNGTWEYAGLVEAGLKPEDLAMIPIYCGVEGEEKAGLCCGTENCWSVNKEASPENIQATLDFMKWVVTSEEGTTMMAEQFGPCPFKSAKAPENVFFAQANDYIAKGNYVVTWAFNYTPAVEDWRAGVVDALSKYVAGGSWDDVKTAFVDGWAAQYAAENAA
ncbi:MAG: ABC transporter substrate-binding protein [Clostridiales bacterium]|nr:ABC transporter substrate-binding protein [Clostridiales bacterium]MCI6961809.1 ABC transporter substrate-binding protein [Clostridiales bacterium]